MIQKPSNPTTPPASGFESISAAIAANIQRFKTEQAAELHRRLLLVGDSGSGKTYSVCTTAPTPLFVLDVDGQMAGVPERDGLFRIPLVSLEDAKRVYPDAGCVFDAVESFFLNGAKSIIKAYGSTPVTFFVDMISTLGDSLMRHLEEKAPVGKSGAKDGQWIWREWGNRWRDLATSIRMTKANVIAAAHEQPEYDDSTPPKLVQYKWYLPGNMFSPRLASFFTDAVRSVRVCKTPSFDMQSTVFPTQGSGPKLSTQQEFRWQIQPETKRPWIKNRSGRSEVLIPADWNELVK